MKRRIGNSDLELTSIAFGAWAAGGWMWGHTEASDAISAMKSAIDAGCTTIDTAPIYGQGTSEILVGEAIKGYDRSKIQILTKFGMRWDTTEGDFAFNSQDNDGQPIAIHKYASKASIIKECEDSLQRLGTDYIDLYQIHWNDITTPIEESFEAVAQLIKEGKVRYAGVCNYDVAMLKRAQSVCEIVSNQIPYSMVNRGIEQDILPYCIEENIAVLAYSPLQRGLLTGKMKAGYTFDAGDHRATNSYFQDDVILATNDLLKQLKPIAEKYNATLGQIVLHWTIMQQGITVALAGARNPQQALSNWKAAHIKFSPEEYNYIDNLIKIANIESLL